MCVGGRRRGKRKGRWKEDEKNLFFESLARTARNSKTRVNFRKVGERKERGGSVLTRPDDHRVAKVANPKSHGKSVDC